MVEYNTLTSTNTYLGDKTDTFLKECFSLNILITRQIYPSGSNTYVYVIQNVTRYTVQQPIGMLHLSVKLVDMILDAILDNNSIKNFRRIQHESVEEGIRPDLDNIISTNPKVSDPGPNENWLIYSIANWFNNITDKLRESFGGWDVQPILDSSLTFVGGMEQSENANTDIFQSYEKIEFVTMIPCIYEQLCSIYEKNGVVYDDGLGKYFILKFILNLTRYSLDPDNRIPTLTPPYNNINNPFDGNNPPNGSNPPIYYDLTRSKYTLFRPYEKQVIHTDDIEFDIKNIRNINIKFKELKKKLEDELTININEQIRKNDEDKNVFTVNDHFARVLIIMSGLTFNDNDNERDKERFLELFPAQDDVVRGQNNTQSNTEGPAKELVDSTPITNKKDSKNVFDHISPLEKNIKQQLQNTPDIEGLPEFQELQVLLQRLENLDVNDRSSSNKKLLFNTLTNINQIITSNSIPLDEKLKNSIKELIDQQIIPESVTGHIMDAGGAKVGGKIIKNKKTRRRMGRTRHKKHNKTNKKHKKHQTSCKNKTRKTKKAKRKNKTR